MTPPAPSRVDGEAARIRSARSPAGATPLFVERQTYRRRRLNDAARLLPILGILLWMVPMLWTTPNGAVSASNALIYLFAVWVVLSVMGAVLSRRLTRSDDTRAPLESGQDTP